MYSISRARRLDGALKVFSRSKSWSRLLRGHIEAGIFAFFTVLGRRGCGGVPKGGNHLLACLG